MSDDQSSMHHGSTDFDEFVEEMGAHLPHAAFEKSGTETVTLELSEANAYRLANSAVVTARVILDEAPENGGWAASQALGLNKEVKRQVREQNHGDNHE